MSRWTVRRLRVLVGCSVLLSMICLETGFDRPLMTSEAGAFQKRKPQPKPQPKSRLPVDSPKMRKGSVAQVDPNSIDRVKRSAAKIDQLVEANYKKFGVTPNPDTTDEEFLRRAYLDIVGTIPNLRQTRVFLNNSSEGNRERLIDSLLGHEGYVAHYYNFWADLLRLKDREGRMRLIPYQTWVKQSLRENKPYDEFVRDLLTAEGKIWEDPAAGYYLTDDGMPLENMSNTVQLFLGTQIGCAQCHDHPFDRWSQKDFYEIAAFTSQVSTRSAGEEGKAFGSVQQTFRKQRNGQSDMVSMGGVQARYGIVQNLVVANRYEISDNPGQQLKLPATYAYENGKPGEVVQPRALFGKEVSVKQGESRRKIFADWLTSPENPRFARTIANRLWKQVMGVGQIEPIDDMKDDTVAENPELMAFLEQEMVRVKFDLKEFLRILMNTKTYQRQSTTTEYDPGVPYHFAGPILRRMTAEQAWDSLLTLAIPNPEAFSKDYDPGFEKTIEVSFKNEPPQKILEKAVQLEDKYLGGKAVAEKERPYSYIPLKDTYQGRYLRVLLARAYELPSPLPPEHFLRQFGQSDRELIAGSSRDGSIPQILTMLNGPSTHMMLESGSVIYDNVIEESDAKKRVEIMFLSILNRNPSTEEMQTALQEIRRAGNRGYGNVIWALVNTREFLFVQ
ncbi:MAG TPA: DUF1549 and DUF1553 domain-containing protein [Planctomycetaceae bacterium]|nr:DUF1549 and DUF1553 domain-containing protein [Planctomycetaceae bacterium]